MFADDTDQRETSIMILSALWSAKGTIKFRFIENCLLPSYHGPVPKRKK